MLYILLVEDYKADADQITNAFQEIGADISLEWKADAKQALRYLDNIERLPDLILLDLNMPVMSGLDFLERIKLEGSPSRSVPVVVLTTDDNQYSIDAAFEFGAAGYMLKPIEAEEMCETLRRFNKYWTTSKLPERNC